MRAVRVTEYGDASVLTPETVPEPTPDEDELRIDVVAAGVNFADVVKRQGRYPDGPTPPYVPGIEVAGRVDAAGAEAPFEVGEAVVAYALEGGYAESTVVDADRAFSAPDGVSLAEAAGVPIQWLTAHNALFEWGDLAAGERVLVHAGAGGVGSAAVQLASNAGAEVFATASTADKRAFARELGADGTIDSIDGDLAAEVDALTGGEGVDLVLDGVGGEAFDASLAALAPGGRIVAYGLASGEVPRVSTPRLFFENYSVVGYHLGHAVEHEPDRVFGAMESIAAQLSSGDADVIVDRAYPLEEAATAHEHLQDRRTRGKVLLEP